MTGAFSTLLDLELERCGWTDRNRAFDAQAQEFRRDLSAFISRIDAIQREAGVPNKQPAAN